MTGARSRSSYHHGDLRRALIDVSLMLIHIHGVDGFSLRAAARQVGVDPAAVYRHFADKSALLGAVAAVGFRRLADQMVTAMASEADPSRRFLLAGDAYVRFALADPEYFKVMFGPHGSGPHGGARGHGGDAEGRSAYTLLVDLLTQLAATGHVTGPVEAAALTVWSTLHGLATLVVERAIVLSDIEVDDAIDRLTRSALRGLAA